jgi:hypothetical protein
VVFFACLGSGNAAPQEAAGRQPAASAMMMAMACTRCPHPPQLPRTA